MEPTTTANKVRAYRVLVQGFRVAAIVFALLGTIGLLSKHVIPGFVFLFGAAILLQTSFASSKAKFTKEVTEVILPYCRKRNCGFRGYPTTKAQCDLLREDKKILDELTGLAQAAAEAEEKVTRSWRGRDAEYIAVLAEKYEARRALKTVWDFYQNVGPVGVLPFRDASRCTEWKDDEAFLQNITQTVPSVQGSEEYA